MAERKKITPDTVVNPDFIEISDMAEDKVDRRGRSSLQGDAVDERQESGLIADANDDLTIPHDGAVSASTPTEQGNVSDGTSKPVPYGGIADDERESCLIADDGNADGTCADGEELVEIVIPFDHVDSGKKFEKFSINLKEFIIPIGEPVMVPRYVRDYWLCLNKQKHKFGIARNALEGSASPENY